VRARVKPELIRWVREDAGLSVAVVAKKTGTSIERVQQWEEGKLAPTLRQLRLLGNAAKRPLAVFYLSVPPKRFHAMRDFRRLPGDPMAEGSPELRLAIRAAVARREVALELVDALGDSPPRLTARVSLSESPLAVAGRVREVLDIDLDTQRGWRQPYDALNGWRDVIEAQGVLVSQASGIDVQEMRGLSIVDGRLPIILLNVKDAPNGRVFTLLHEFMHVLLRLGGVCDLSEGGDRPPEEDRIEIFCNAVAAQVLVPLDALAETGIVREHGPSMEWTDEELRRLSRSFSVSREVVLRRLLEAGRTSRTFYRGWRERYLKEYEQYRSEQGGFAPPDVQAVSHAGPAFVRLVLASYYQERITSRDVSEYLGVRLKHLANIEARVMGRPVAFR
jgi:Zn-dependent peptidase ImmA (M78 family)/transcriptional regulator with XRE-family HTH domain